MSNKILKNVNRLLEGKGNLLYLTEFGSRLYGTFQEGISDHDYKGIFIPSLDYFFSWQNPKAISVTTGNSNSKNTKEDVDIQLYSLPYFIHKLLSTGDTSALDIVYSFTNENMVLYGNDNIKSIVNNIDKILNIKTANAYVGYAIGQAKKYGIKGSRLGVLRNIKEYVENDINREGDIRLSDFVDDILEKFGDSSYCFHKQVENKGKVTDYLFINGSQHQYNIKMDEFKQRIDKAFNSYGDRTRKAEEDGGVDFKALSHSVRVLYQCKELYRDGQITFPLKGEAREKTLSVKTGKNSYNEVEELILSLLAEVDEARNKCKLNWKYKNKYCLELVKGFYKRYHGDI